MTDAMTELTVTQRPRRNVKPMRVVSEQQITPEWANALITQAMPILQELYRKALAIKRAEALDPTIKERSVNLHEECLEGFAHSPWMLSPDLVETREETDLLEQTGLTTEKTVTPV